MSGQVSLPISSGRVWYNPLTWFSRSSSAAETSTSQIALHAIPCNRPFTFIEQHLNERLSETFARNNSVIASTASFQSIFLSESSDRVDTHLNLSKTAKEITDDVLIGIILNNPYLESLTLEGCYLLTDVGFSQLSLLTQLKYLNANGCINVSAEGLQCIPLHELEFLSLQNCSFNDEFCSHLRSASKLKDLTLSRDYTSLGKGTIGDAGITSLASISTLTFLSLQGAFFGTGEGAISLASLTNLISLNILANPSVYWNNITELFAELGNLPLLKDLNVSGIEFQNSDLRGFQNSKLKILTLCSDIEDGTGYVYLPQTLEVFYTTSFLVDTFVPAISHLTNLRELTALIGMATDGKLVSKCWEKLSNLEILKLGTLDPIGIASISVNHPKLRVLALEYTNDTISAFLPLSKCSHLRSLALFNLTDSLDPLIVAFASQPSPPPLTILAAPLSTLSDQGLQALTTFGSTLQVLSLNLALGTASTPLQAMTNLRKLYLSSSLNSSGFSFLSQMSKMEELFLTSSTASGSKQEVDASVFESISHMGNLQLLTLDNATGATNDNFALFTSTPLKRLAFFGLEGINDGAVDPLEKLVSIEIISTNQLSQQACQELQINLELIQPIWTFSSSNFSNEQAEVEKRRVAYYMAVRECLHE